MNESTLPDPFATARRQQGIGKMVDQGDPVTMLLRFKDVRKAARNYRLFQSGAEPGRIVIPSEMGIRSIRQIPFELDLPAHTAYRAVLEEWFRRPREAAYTAALARQIDVLLDAALAAETFEAVSEFALVLQSQALTLLLNVEEEVADTWIGWGTHVFRSEGVALDGAKAEILYRYIDEQIDRAIAAPGDDLYSALLATEVNGQLMTREEVAGVLVLTFAGGRDTVINAITNTLAYFAEHPDALARLRQDPEGVNPAVEELLRYFTPLTQMGRVVTEDTQVCAHAVRADTRISLCWASANRDETVFERPDEVDLGRTANPHVGFGFGPHNCLGATHARQLLRTLVSRLADRVKSIDVVVATETIEELGNFRRKVGFEQLVVRFHPR